MENKYVSAAWLHECSQIRAPGGITEWPATDQLPVQPDCRIGHGSVHIEENGFGSIIRRNVQVLAIPADASAWQSTHAATACASEGAFDGPIVRQIDLLPRAVV